MIDTIQFFYEPDKLDIKEIKEKFKTHKSGEFTWYLNSKDNEFKMWYKPNYIYLFIRVNPKKVLNKICIVNEDYNSLVEKINLELKTYFTRITFENLELSRIDYKKDINLYKDIYIEILKKVSNTFRRKNKKIYNTSVYFRGKSYNLNLYDKGAECKSKGKDLKEYEDTLRLEIQIKRTYLKSLFSSLGLEISLFNYFHDNMRLFIFKKVLEPLLYRGDYYTIEESRKMLNKFYTKNMTEKIIAFQRKIFKYGITIARNSTPKNTGDKYLKILKEIEVNPITFKKIENVKKLPSLISYL